MEQNATVDRTTRLLALTTALGDASTTEDVADVVLEFGLGVVEAGRGYFACVEGCSLTMIAARGYTDDMRARIMQINERSGTAITDAARNGKPIWLESVQDYIERYPWAFERFGAVSGSQAHVAMPLTYRGVVIGALGLSFPAPTSFGASDRAFMMLLAQVAAGALHRARSYDTALQRREHAEGIAAARADVLGVVAHDLRNPLSLIDMTAQFLIEADPPIDRRRELLAAARRATARMDRLVGDLLDAVRMQSGSLRLELREMHVAHILRAVDESYRALASKSRIDLHIEGVDQAVCARGDETRIVQAIGNLLGNALKFTRAGGCIRLSVACGDREVTFSVTDSGPGIPESEAVHVFDRFWQARKSDHKGVGLGLAIVKGIVDAHGGRLWLNSTVGVGSTFAFTLPRCPQASATTAREQLTISELETDVATIAAA